ncbi:Zn(II)2Cys6 transcription factor rglT [Aspergillus stella-maris]|uniref:Zn(II)2Cys6 transcription factor rglT n=1 Tax=Aspergillus stella-maris TaxID=1810926 RepID=UPI003CCC974B
MQYESYQWGQTYPASNGDSMLPDVSIAASQPVKRHAACDECRKRKLKCSGEHSGCSRCVKQSLPCHYSVQKQMGRPPKKRLREEDEDLAYLNVSNNDPWSNPDATHIPPSDLRAAISDVTENPQLLNPTYPSPYSFPYRLSTDEDHRHTWQLAPSDAQSSVPATSSPWPDFSSVSAAAPKPFTMPPGLTPPEMPTPSVSSPDQECTCLSYLYLCLSHLSSLKPFPVSQHTVCSLYISARTAQSVIRCQSCPTKFDTGLQNVMFTGTLLNVIADSWLRVSEADPCVLGPQVAPTPYAAAMSKSSDVRAAWTDYLRQLVRFSVIRGPMDLTAQTACAQSAPSVLDLVEEMETRQRRWHESPGSHPFPGAQPPLPATDENGLNRDEQELLCVRVANSARNVIAKFEFQSDEYPESVPSLSPDSSVSP